LPAEEQPLGNAFPFKVMENSNEPIELSGALKRWRVTTPLPPRFQAAVWQRIAREQARVGLFDRLAEWAGSLLLQPLPRLAYIVLLIGMGISAGLWSGNAQSARTESDMLIRYVESVDPYRAHRH
jgi:hypothetical protein